MVDTKTGRGLIGTWIAIALAVFPSASLAIANPGNLEAQRLIPIEASIEKAFPYPGGSTILATKYGASADRQSFLAEGLYRLTADGSFDPSFGAGGFVEMPWSDVVVGPDGRIIVAGYGRSSVPVARLLPDGEVDPGFGQAGEVKVHLGTDREVEAHGIAIAPDGRIVISGKFEERSRPAWRSRNRPAMARLRSDGSLDPSFGGDGTIEPEIREPPPAFGPVAFAPDGSIVAIVYAGQGARWSRLVRIEPDGSLDRSFGDHGYARVAGRAAKPPIFAALEKVVLLRDGRIVMAGDVSRYLGDGEWVSWGVVRRLLASGRPDRSYGGDGVVRTHSKGSFFPEDIVVRPDGSAMLLGDRIRGRDSDLAIAAFRPNGRPDPRYGHGGMAFADFCARVQSEALVFQPGGALIAFGDLDGPDRTIAARFEPRPAD